jgi:ubiquinone/menaquinone biosynthesis C-methylase UbiE
MSTEQVHRPSAQQIRERVHHMWGGVAPAWERHADQVERRVVALSDLMIDAFTPAPRDEVLELACGAGGLGLALAQLVTPGGRVLLSDVAPEMVAIAAARAGSLPRTDGEPEVSARVIDLEQVDLPDSCFDIVVCREGLMFALDPAQAAREIARVTRPGGRVAITVWGPRDRNPWLGVLADGVQERTGVPVPPPGIPGPFSLSAEGDLAAILAGAGLERIRVAEVAVPTHDASFEDYWQLRTALAGPLKGLIDALPSEQQATLKETVRARLTPYQGPDGLKIPGLAYLATACGPDHHRHAARGSPPT